MQPNSVVRVFATTQEPDYHLPWQSSPPYEGSGSGVVIGPGRILTGAHVVANATFVQVRKISHPEKIVARVAEVCHDCDLALLAVDAPAFMQGVTPARLGDLRKPGDHVSVVGFPVGGDEMSVTEGVVSRVEVSNYSHSQRRLLTVTVDAAINSGNSGGPVFCGDAIAGIAFQVMEEAENIGELVPAPLVERFLRGIEAGRSLDAPDLGIWAQFLENDTLRRHVGLDGDTTGIAVTRVRYGGSAWGVLEPGDVLVRVDGHAIANNGTIRYRNRFRTGVEAVIGDHYVGDEIDLEIMRRGHRHTLRVELEPHVELVPRWRYDRRPTYFIFAGMVFQVLTLDYLATWKDWWNNAPKELLYHYQQGFRTATRREVIVLTDVLNDGINVGYSDFCEETVATVNGKAPRDMRHFVDLVESCEGVVEIVTTADHRLAVDATAARAAGPDLLERYDVSADRSADLR